MGGQPGSCGVFLLMAGVASSSQKPADHVAASRASQTLKSCGGSGWKGQEGSEGCFLSTAHPGPRQLSPDHSAARGGRGLLASEGTA